MAKLNFRYLPMSRIDRAQADTATMTFLNPFSISRPDTVHSLKHSSFCAPSLHIDLDKKLNSKLTVFEEMRAQAEETSKSLDERARLIEKKRNELNAGIGMLPTDLPEEFQKAVNSAIDSARETITKEALEIAEAADAARKDANNALYEIRKEQERLSKSVRRFSFLCSIPFIGNIGAKRYDLLFSKNEQLLDISNDTNCHYERLLYSRSLVNNLCQ